MGKRVLTTSRMDVIIRDHGRMACSKEGESLPVQMAKNSMVLS